MDSGVWRHNVFAVASAEEELDRQEFAPLWEFALRPSPRPHRMLKRMINPAPHPNDGTRLCEYCLQRKPLTEFRRRTRDGSARLKQCRECHNKAERERHSAAREKQDRRQMAKYLTRLSNAGNDQVVAAICREMLACYGGFDAFLAAFTDYQKRSVEQGGLAAHRCFASIIRLLQYCDQNQS